MEKETFAFETLLGSLYERVPAVLAKVLNMVEHDQKVELALVKACGDHVAF